jgi:hypothetical protein
MISSSPVANKLGQSIQTPAASAPAKVYFYLYVKAINCINIKDSTFQVVFHQYLQWHPTAVEFEFFRSNQDTGIGSESLHVPRILPSNMLELIQEEEETRGNKTAVHLLVDGGLDVWGTKIAIKEAEKGKPLLGLSRKYQMIISAPTQLVDFPMDIQHFHMFFESMTTTEHVLYFPTIIYPRVLSLEFGAFASDPDYIFHDPVVEFAAFGESPNSYACCTVSFKLERIVAGTMFRVFIPCAMLTLLCLSLFVINYQESADRLSVIVTLILALVAFLYVVAENSPPIPYLTLADKYITCSLIYVSLLTLYVVVAASGTCIQSVETDVNVGWACLGVWGVIQIVFLCVGYVAKKRNLANLPLSYSELSDAGLLVDDMDGKDVSVSSAKVLYDKYKED